MEKIYSLKEIAEMKKATCKVIEQIIVAEASDEPKTARELAEATGGLCSPQHIAGSITPPRGWYCWTKYMGLYGETHIENTGKKTIERTRHFIEIDDNGNELGRVDKTTSYSVNTYKVIK